MTGVSQAKDSKITLGNPSFKLLKTKSCFFLNMQTDYADSQ
jgi:hypothetical protein